MPAHATKPVLIPRGIRVKLAARYTNRAGTRPRPLGDVNDAMKALDLSDEEVIQLLHNRALRGINIASDPGGRPRYRILTGSLEHFHESGGREPLKLEWPEIWKLIFDSASRSQSLTGPQIQRAFNCSRRHVNNMAPHFKIIRRPRSGRGNIATFTTASVEAWLKGRLL